MSEAKKLSTAELISGWDRFRSRLEDNSATMVGKNWYLTPLVMVPPYHTTYLVLLLVGQCDWQVCRLWHQR